MLRVDIAWILELVPSNNLFNTHTKQPCSSGQFLKHFRQINKQTNKQKSLSFIIYDAHILRTLIILVISHTEQFYLLTTLSNVKIPNKNSQTSSLLVSDYYFFIGITYVVLLSKDRTHAGFADPWQIRLHNFVVLSISFWMFEDLHFLELLTEMWTIALCLYTVLKCWLMMIRCLLGTSYCRRLPLPHVSFAVLLAFCISASFYHFVSWWDMYTITVALWTDPHVCMPGGQVGNFVLLTTSTSEMFLDTSFRTHTLITEHNVVKSELLKPVDFFVIIKLPFISRSCALNLTGCSLRPTRFPTDVSYP